MPNAASPTTLIYPGTFDPITNGHLNLIKRAARLFDRLIVAVAVGHHKRPLFSLDERIELIQHALDSLGNAETKKVVVLGFKGLLADLLQKHNAHAVLRGLRTVADFDYEFALANMNRKLCPEFETVFLTPDTDYAFVSSSLILEIAQLGGDTSKFIPPNVLSALQQKFTADHSSRHALKQGNAQHGT